MAHDFIRFPELSNNQMRLYYHESPHKQITKNFTARVKKVIDGDTLKLEWEQRDFPFEIRIINIDSKELGEGGEEAKQYLKEWLEGELVDVLIDPENRTEKWGRLLGDVRHLGQLVSKDMLRTRHAVRFDERHRGKLPNINKELNIKNWLT